MSALRCLVCLAEVAPRQDLCPACLSSTIQLPAWVIRYRRMLRIQGRGPFRESVPVRTETQQPNP